MGNELDGSRCLTPYVVVVTMRSISMFPSLRLSPVRLARLITTTTPSSSNGPTTAFLDELTTIKHLRPDTWYLIAVRLLFHLFSTLFTHTHAHCDRRQHQPHSATHPPGYQPSTPTPSTPSDPPLPPHSRPHPNPSSRTLLPVDASSADSKRRSSNPPSSAASHTLSKPHLRSKTLSNQAIKTRPSSVKISSSMRIMIPAQRKGEAQKRYSKYIAIECRSMGTLHKPCGTSVR